MSRPVLFSGLDLVAPELPEGWTFLRPQSPKPALGHLDDEVRQALDAPLSGAPLSERIARGARVLIVVDDPLELVAPPPLHPLRVMLTSVLDRIVAACGPRGRVDALVANGLGRALTAPELSAILGPELCARLPLRSHDAEAYQGHRTIGDLRLDAALLDADLIVQVGIRRLAPQLPLESLIRGLSTHTGLQALPGKGASTPGDEPGLRDIGQALSTQVPVFSVLGVMNSGLLGMTLEAVLSAPGRSMHTWNRLPYPVRRRLASGWRSVGGVCEVFAGDPLPTEEAAGRCLVEGLRAPPAAEFDALVVAVPDVSPHAFGAISNPVLAAHLGLVSLAGPALSLLRRPAPVVLLHPLREDFDDRQHLPYQPFYREILSAGAETLSRAEVEWAGRPEFVAAYRRRGSVHGAHPFLRWREVLDVRQRLGPVLVLGGGTAAAQRLGFEPVDDWSEAYSRLQEITGLASPRLAVIDRLPVWAAGNAASRPAT